MSFPGGSGVEKPPASADVSSIPGSGRPPAGGHGNRSRVPAWRSPWAEEPGGPQCVGSRRVRQDRVRSQQQQSRLRGPDGVPGVWGLTPGAGTGKFFQSENSYLLCLGIFLKLFLWSFPLFPLMSHPPPLNTLLVKCWISWIEPLISFFLFTFHLLSIYSAFYPFPQWLRWSRIRLQYGRPGFDPWVGRSAGGGHSNPLQDSCLENPHGQKSLAGYSPWGRKESDRTEGLGTTILLSGVFPQLYLLTSYWVFLLVCLFKYSFIWLLRVLVAAHWVLVVTCGISFPNQRLTQNPALGARSLSHWPTREVSYLVLSF